MTIGSCWRRRSANSHREMSPILIVFLFSRTQADADTQAVLGAKFPQTVPEESAVAVLVEDVVVTAASLANPNLRPSHVGPTRVVGGGKTAGKRMRQFRSEAVAWIIYAEERRG